MRRLALHCWLCVMAVSGMVGSAQAVQTQSDSANDAEFENLVLPYLKQYCFSCHGESNAQPEGVHTDFRLDMLTPEFLKNGDAWQEVIEQVRSDQMPPAKTADRPTAVQSAAITDWLTRKINQHEASRAARREPVSFHRLSRQEYANTINDLRGIAFHVDDAGRLNPDDVWHGFTRIGSALSVSASHIEKYLDAGGSILDEAFPDKEPGKVKLSANAQELAGGVAPLGTAQFKTSGSFGIKPEPRLDLWPGQRAGVETDTAWVGGTYRFRIRVSGLKSNDGRSPHLAIFDQYIDRLLFEKDIVASEKQAVEISFEVHLPPGQHHFMMTNEVAGPPVLTRLGKAGKPFYSIKDGYLPWQLALLDSKGALNYPCLIVDGIKIEGPIITVDAVAKRKRFWPEIETDPSQIRECLARFAEHAFRRPVSQSEIGRFATLVGGEIERGENPRRAIKTGMLAILTSKDFLYLVEGSLENPAVDLTDWELASRLSYFLWSSMPDERLFELARSGTLHQKEVLEQTINRMLEDPRSARFTADFSGQWLQLNRVGMFKPNARLYPDYDLYLQRSMKEETTRFFDQVVRSNLTLREFIASDWTMLNRRLARHYGIDLGNEIESGRFRRVALKPDHRRGGVLTQASILSLTSDGTRHRPVHRGVWIVESILGQTIPSPPANVEPIEPNPVDQLKSTVRSKLEAHVANPNCSICHQKIDPLGFAFDNYDAIGKWRTEEAVPTGAGANPTVDASGKLSDGRSFGDAAELQMLLRDEIGTLNATLVNKMATYGLRRAMTVDDKAALSEIENRSMSNDYRMRDMIEEIVLSDLFKKR